MPKHRTLRARPVAANTGSVKPRTTPTLETPLFFPVYTRTTLFLLMPWAGYGGMGNAGSGTTTRATAWALELSEKMLQEAKEGNRAALLQMAEATAKHAETGAAEDADALEKAKVDATRAKAYLTHAKNSRNAVRIKNMLELSKPALVVKADKLDANPFDLNTPAGILELTAGGSAPTSGVHIAARSRRPGRTPKGARCGAHFSTPLLAVTAV